MKKILTTILFILIVSSSMFAEIFSYKYEEGMNYRIVSEVDEVVLADDVFLQRSEFLNTVSIDIVEVDDFGGLLNTIFRTSERAFESDLLYSWSSENESVFYRNSKGEYTIDDVYVQPSTRNVPLFPDYELFPGDTWYAMAEEIHDISPTFGINQLISIPFRVFYTYEGKAEYNDEEWDLFDLSYHFFYQPDIEPGQDFYPVKIKGSFHDDFYWNQEKGIPAYTEGTFEFEYEMSDGIVYTFRGSSVASVILGEDLSGDLDQIQQQLDDSGMEDVSIRQEEAGLVITLQNISFLPDSAVLRESEKEKLETIIEILLNYPNRAVYIEGHAARLGSEDYLQTLSESRATAVGEFLVERGVKDPEELVIRGMGSLNPLADNATEEGREQNRRVEITIMEN